MSHIQNQYRNDIIRRVGGISQYNVIVYDMAERMMEDPTLKFVYDTVTLEGLCKMQRRLLDVALLRLTSGQREKLFTRAKLEHHQIFEHGFNEGHLDQIKKHLVEAMLLRLVDEDALDDVVESFEKLMREFVAETSESRKNDFPSSSHHHATMLAAH
eukprot:Nitzschia sp. Nitz4//scaffold163_size50693//50476//50946//NITZ4_006996-RA/size50693-processed-gene-0.50-mRNA-1//-1//CDS//3329538055//3027//frame0